MPFSSEWKWSGVSRDGGGGASYVLGAPDVLAEAGALTLPPRPRPRSSKQETAAGRRVVAFGETGEALPDDPPPAGRRRDCTPLALVVLEETLRPDAAETIAFMREQEVDLKLISGDAARDRDRGRLRGRRARATPA